MGREKRLDQTIKCFQTIQALNRPRGITAPQLQDILECSLSTAYRYLDSASCVFPIISDNGWPAKFKFMGGAL